MTLSFAACGNSADQTRQSSAEESRTEQSSMERDSVESITNDVASTESSNTSDVESADVSQVQETKILVAYFSTTNTTEGVAEHIAKGLNADIYEIIPEEPYTDADLNYNDNNSRTTMEMNDADARLAISGSVENMEQYDIVFIGFAGGIIGLN